jgi:L-lactate dehydrogenase (cytochrome)
MSRLESPSIVNIADLRVAARRRLPNAVFDYLEGTADDGVTGRDNLAAFSEVVFAPRQAVTVEPDLSTRLMGARMAMPVMLSPIGYCRLLHPGGDVAAARAGKAAGVPFIQATGSGFPMEAVHEVGGPLFFQVYQMGGRAAAERALGRARKLGFKGIFVTVDTPVSGNRERDPRNGMKALMGPKLLPKLPYVPEVLAHPRWLISFLRDGGMPAMPNVVGEDGRSLPAPDVERALANANICWDDLGWIRKAWDGPIIVKGIMRADDARRALDEGADGIVVSNHGGRQLDCAAATLRVLPGIAEAVKGRAHILIDSGIRRGGDIAKALCLGADAVLIGRAYGYGLAAAGEAGVARALEILRADLMRTMKLLGAASLRDLTRDKVFVKDGFRVD